MVQKLLIIASVIISLTNASAPSITPCVSTDSDCITENARRLIPVFADGIPDYGVKTADPITFKSIDASSPNLKFLLSDLTVKGLRNCKAIKLARSNVKYSLFLKLSCALTIDGDYEMEGEILVLKIVGKGKVHAFLPNIEITADLETVEKEKNGEKYLRIKKFNHSFDLKAKSDLKFEGLLKDNQVLAQATEDLLQNSSNEVIKEIGGKVVETVVTGVIENVNHFFGKLPLKEYYLD
ncbi:protein takeout [Helicoverpa armigera]|uniref:protein takeout n=1 Tax=Helicoverpa armigera TaxID=29058 RepID=UPI00308375E7